MLASIRASGGVGGGGLKKVSDKDKSDRSSAMVPGAESNARPAAPAASAGADGGMQNALQAVLAKRNKKVAASGKSTPRHFLVGATNINDDADDEDNDNDEW